MDKEEQKIAIIIALGDIATRCISELEHRNDDENSRRRADIYLRCYPDYTDDLGAMHEVEKTLDEDKRFLYETTLHSLNFKYMKQMSIWETIHASAAQRAEAFLKVIGKWEP
jgi:hypothetical protein